MAFSMGSVRPSSPRVSTSTAAEEYDSSSSADSDLMRTRLRSTFVSSSASGSAPRHNFLFPPNPSGRSSLSSTAASTPLPSRSTSPLPQYYPSNNTSSCTSETDDDEPASSPLMRSRTPWWRENRRSWWSTSRRRRRRNGRISRFLKKWTRPIVRHPLFPSQPITIVLTLTLLSLLALCITLLLMYILNPDKEPLPWRAYCSAPSFSTSYDPSGSQPTVSYTSPTFPPANLDTLSPAGLFIGVFSVDSGFERRQLVRTTWASHARSREGAGEGDGGVGTSRTVVRFILGQPDKDWERRIKLESEMYNDIVILPITENMNRGKTHTFFSWASINAWVPPVLVNTTTSPPLYSYSNYTSSPPPLAPHDSFLAWEDHLGGNPKSWVRPDYVVKVDDDSFVMLAELEARLRLELHSKPQHHDHEPSEAITTTLVPPHTPSIPTNSSEDDITYAPQGIPHTSAVSHLNDPLVYWGYLVTNRLHTFMAGELYSLSWSLVEWVAKDPTVKGLTRGAEDKQTAKWMKLHPRASDVRWVSERCWIYDHPRAGTVYSHGFIFPSEVTRVKRSMMSYLDKNHSHVLSNPSTVMGAGTPPTPAAWAYSSVSTFKVRYSPPLPDLSIPHSVEALVEGSDMSLIREGSPMTPDHAWTHREGRQKRYEGKRVGGTVVVHFIKKNMWYLETALALLEGEEFSEAEKFQSRELEKATQVAPPSTPRMITGHSNRRPGSQHASRR